MKIYKKKYENNETGKRVKIQKKLKSQPWVNGVNNDQILVNHGQNDGDVISDIIGLVNGFGSGQTGRARGTRATRLVVGSGGVTRSIKCGPWGVLRYPK